MAFQHHTTILYGLQRTGGQGSFTDHLIYPLLFLIKQTILIFIYEFFFNKKINIRLNFKDEKLIFLIFTTIVPILLILLTSMIWGQNKNYVDDPVLFICWSFFNACF